MFFSKQDSGWTIFDKLYFLKGVAYVVTDDPSQVPETAAMYHKGGKIDHNPQGKYLRRPADEDIRIISTREAKQLFGSGAQVIGGMTFLVNDPPQFLNHYYHWSAELTFGLWRTYSSLDTGITENGTTTLPPPRRMLFNRLDASHWRDYAHMNQFVLRTAFPSISLEFSDDWRDRSEMGVPFVFERVLIADRSAAMPAYNYQRSQRTASVPFGLPGSSHISWWMTVRNNVVRFTGLDPSFGKDTTDTPVITYVSRQGWRRRRLIPEHHDRLVKELYKLRDEHGYEVNVVCMEDYTREEQIRLAARTTVMMGVHGNGLTALVWMNPTPRSTVMEFFYPQGFAHDYEWTARAMGMKHYSFWNDKFFTSPALPVHSYPDGFQGNSIPIDGAAVARLVHERVSMARDLND
ncbi:hypothetical protein V5O48_003031 [Marasmius crinis-equi]|uniref:Glycosyltransferase 61 catalytic domain-containing protein n=1 Tax=Marasmius crinis-equi TaxID=585013 RepID=A0ABR3FUY4_9AGAR